LLARRTLPDLWPGCLTGTVIEDAGGQLAQRSPEKLSQPNPESAAGISRR
jgi:hypothetical protein